MVMQTNVATGVIAALGVLLLAFVIATGILGARVRSCHTKTPHPGIPSAFSAPAPAATPTAGTQLAAVPDAAPNSGPPPAHKTMIVSLTTIPARFADIPATITNLLTQTRPADAIILNIPKQYSVRFKEGIPERAIEAFKKQFPTVIVFRPEVDEGPGTKLLGALQALASWRDSPVQAKVVTPDVARLYDAVRGADTIYNTPGDVFVVLGDDDRQYPPFALERFEAAMSDPTNHGKALSGCVFRSGDTIVGQGADLYAIPLRVLHAIKPYFNLLRDDKSCVFHDDMWISAYLAAHNVPIAAVDVNIVNRDFANTQALLNLQGDLSREQVTRGAQAAIDQVNLLWRQRYPWLAAPLDPDSGPTN